MTRDIITADGIDIRDLKANVWHFTDGHMMDSDHYDPGSRMWTFEYWYDDGQREQVKYYHALTEHCYSNGNFFDDLENDISINNSSS